MGGLFQLLPFLGLKEREGRLKYSRSYLLVIVCRSLRLKNVLVASEGIPVVHVSKFFNKCIHLDVVFKFLTVNKLSLLLYDLVKASAIRQLELVVHLNFRGLNTSYFCRFKFYII